MDGATLQRVSVAETETVMASIANRMRNVNPWILIALLMETLRILTYVQLTTNVVVELLPECVVNKVDSRIHTLDTTTRCLKITQNVPFEFFNFGIFRQFLSY